MSSDFHADLMAARRPTTDAFDDHVLACVLAQGLAEAAAGEATLTEATGLSGAEIVDLVAARFPGATALVAGQARALAPACEIEEELLRELLARHGAGRGDVVGSVAMAGATATAPPTVATIADADGTIALAATADTDGPIARAPSSSPPSRGRDREGGQGISSATPVHDTAAAPPLPVPPPRGGRGRVGTGPSEHLPSLDIAPILATVIARRAMRADHLWQDLGLTDRSELGRLLARHFPALHAGNTANMRWKKYFYRKLCEAEGFVLCAAPSCAQCTDFAACFGAEDGESRLARNRRAYETAERPVAVAAE